MSNSKTATRYPGSDLVPSLDRAIKRKSAEYAYWVGVLPSCPVDSCDIGGINFPKVNQQKYKDPGIDGRPRLVPKIGAIALVNEAQLQRIKDRLRHTVLRRTGEITTDPETGLVRSRGHLVKIPTEEEIAFREAKGKPTNRYVQRETDEPIARYLFARLCSNQSKPVRGEEYPDPLELTGFEWPRESNEDHNTKAS